VKRLAAAFALLGLLALTPHPAPAQDVSSANDDAAFSDLDDIDGAIAQATEMMDQNPGDPANLFRRGRLYFAKGDYLHAIRDFTNVLQNDPDNVLALFQRGRSYYRNNDLDAAIPDFTAYLRLRPKSAPAYINLGAAQLGKGDYGQAIASETQAIQLDPSAVFAFLNRGRAYKLKGEDDKAIDDFTSALQLDPKRAATWLARADVREEKGDYANARADYKETIKLDPAAAAAYNGLAWQLATCPDPRFRDGKIAAVAAERACEISHWNSAGFLDTLAAAYAEAGDFANAVKWETKFLTYYIPEPEANDGQARLKLYQGKQPYHSQGEPLPANDNAN
jgi:tetratricopeptide (TPR) repeat protein